MDDRRSDLWRIDPETATKNAEADRLLAKWLRTYLSQPYVSETHMLLAGIARLLERETP